MLLVSTDKYLSGFPYIRLPSINKLCPDGRERHNIVKGLGEGGAK